MNTHQKVAPRRSQNRLLAICLVASNLFLSAGWAHAEVAVQAWVRRYSQVTDSADQARKLVTDNAGNVIVAGSTYDGITGDDMLVIKYSGVPLWTNRYNGPATGSDSAADVAVGSNGDVFVTGTSSDSNGYPNYATIAYSGSGVPLWTNLYNGLGNNLNYARAVAVDGSGNVFVTGMSSSCCSYDCATIKYSGAGVPLWTNRYDGPWDSFDQALALAVDGNGDVVVTGASSGNGTAYATIKYSGSGVPLWTNFYHVPGRSTDAALAMAVDSSGNVFVTGSSDGSGSFSDYATIKYSAEGVPLWINRYNGPGNGYDGAYAAAVDGSGNVFVTGYSRNTGDYGSEDYATIKYSGMGVPLWTNRYNGPGNGYDFAADVAVDVSGNVFVTGSSYVGDVYSYCATIKYSGAGVPLWTNRYEGQARAVAVDASNNVFVTGSSTGSWGSSDYVTIKYSAEGVPLWTNRYNGPANGDDSPRGKQSLALGPDGSVYVTGASGGDYSSGGGSADFATVKYISGPRLTLEGDGTGGFFIYVDGAPDVTYRLQRAPAQ